MQAAVKGKSSELQQQNKTNVSNSNETSQHTYPSRVLAEKVNESKASDNLSILEELQVVENRISEELGIKIQLVGQVATSDAVKADESVNRWAYPREPSPITSSTRASTPVRITSDKKAASLNVSLNASSESLNKTKLNYSDGDTTMNRSKTRSRQEPLKKPDVNPRKIKDYEELRKKRLALMLQAFTGREDTDNLLEEARHKSSSAISDNITRNAPAATPIGPQDRETISARVKEIIARYSDTNVKSTGDNRTEINTVKKGMEENTRKVQPTKVPYYKQERRQVYPHKRNYRPPGSEVESEAEYEMNHSIDGNIREQMHICDTHLHATSDTDTKLTKTITNHRHRNEIKHRTNLNDNSQTMDRPFSPRNSNSNPPRHRSTSSKRSLSPGRSSSNRQRSPSPRAHRSPNPKQTNLNYSSSRQKSHNTQSELANNFESNDTSLTHSRNPCAPNYLHGLSRHGDGADVYTSKLSSPKRHVKDYGTLDSALYIENCYETGSKVKYNTPFHSSSSESQTPEGRETSDPYLSHLRESRSNVRRSPIDRTVQYDTDSHDTAALVAKYTSSRSPSSSRSSRNTDTSVTSETEFLVTRAGSIQRIDRRSSSERDKYQSKTEKLSTSEQYLNEEVARATSSGSGGDVYWKEHNLSDRARSSSHPSSTSVNVSSAVKSNQERTTTKQSVCSRSSPKSPSFPWHSNKGSQENLTTLNVTDEEKRMQASTSSLFSNRHSSSSVYRHPASPRFASLTQNSRNSSSNPVNSSRNLSTSSSFPSSRLDSSRIGSRQCTRDNQSSTNDRNQGSVVLDNGCNTPRRSLYNIPSESLTRHTISSSLKSGASRAHQVGILQICLPLFQNISHRNNTADVLYMYRCKITRSSSLFMETCI